MTGVSALLQDEPEGATPLDADDLGGLIPSWVASRSDLNVAEQENIVAAMVWAFTARNTWTADRILRRDTLVNLHRRMFGDVWRWAGTWRQRQTNIGVEPRRVLTDLDELLGDVRAQTADPARLAWAADEIGVRFHHRLVTIHPFPNGNGRHARLAADLLVHALGRPRFSWGSGRDLINSSESRSSYLHGLRIADREFDYAPLLAFARSQA
jgi:Fic-DOC domain mobile mystery protein B